MQRWLSATIFIKRSILDVLLGSEKASTFDEKYLFALSKKQIFSFLKRFPKLGIKAYVTLQSHDHTIFRDYMTLK